MAYVRQKKVPAKTILRLENIFGPFFRDMHRTTEICYSSENSSITSLILTLHVVKISDLYVTAFIYFFIKISADQVFETKIRKVLNFQMIITPQPSDQSS